MFDVAAGRSKSPLCALFVLGLPALIGCGGTGQEGNHLSDRQQLPPDLATERATTGQASDDGDPRYDGFTLTQWRERIKQIRFDTPEAAEAVPGLIEIVRDRNVPWYTRRQAALTLGRIGEPAQSAVPVLVELLEETVDDNIGMSARLWSIKALALFGPVARDAAPALIDMLETDSQPHLVRLATLEALGRIGPAHPKTLPAVIDALQHGPAVNESNRAARLELRIAAAEVLELYRGNAALAVPALINASTDESILLRRAAINTLGVIGPSAEPALPALIDSLLFDESDEVRDLAATAMAGIGSAAEPYLAQLLGDPDVAVRRRVAHALGQFDNLDQSTEAVLVAALDDESSGVSLLAAAALWKTTGDPELILEPVVAALGDPERESRMQSVQLLEQIGPTVQFDRAALQSYIETGSSASRRAGLRVLRTWDRREHAPE